MEDKDLNRLLKTRQKFKELNKRQLNKYKVNKHLSDIKRAQELQNLEINQINDRLIALKEEYMRVMSERGLAHRAAQLIEEQDFFHNCFLERRQLMVEKRAITALKDFQRQNSLQQNEIKCKKDKDIQRRKQLMKSSLHKENIDSEDINVLKELQKLENAEKSLRQLIESKKELTHSETSIERNAKKIFWPKKLFSEQEFLHLNVSSLGSEQKLVQNKDKVVLNVNHLNVRKDVAIQTDFNEREVDSIPVSAITLANQLYERFKSRQLISDENKSNKVDRNVAISTATPLPSSHSMIGNNGREYSVGSSQTSYLSLPTAQHISSLSQLYKNRLLNTRANSVDNKSSVSSIDLDLNSLKMNSVDNSVDSLDPLITRINYLKELINKKAQENHMRNGVIEDFNSNESNILLTRDDCSQNRSKSQLINRLNIIRESENNSQKNITSNQLLKVSPLSSVEQLMNDREYEKEGNVEDYSEVCSTTSTNFTTLQALSSSGSSSSDLISQQSDHQKSETLLSVASQEWTSDVDIHSIGSSFMKCEPIRDRNAFWRDVFGRAGLEIEFNQIEDLLEMQRCDNQKCDNETSIDSLSISTFSNAINSHSTPKRLH